MQVVLVLWAQPIVSGIAMLPIVSPMLPSVMSCGIIGYWHGICSISRCNPERIGNNQTTKGNNAMIVDMPAWLAVVFAVVGLVAYVCKLITTN